MKVLNKDEIEMKKFFLMRELESGAIFVYPTDTIYGIGCNGFDTKCLKKIRDLKNRHELPFSIIAPSKEWIHEHCIVDEKAKEWVEKLPGPYTLILKLKNKNLIPKELNSGMDTIGVRIPKHWISDFVKETGVPLVTTSANITGEDFMTSIDNLSTQIKKGVDYIMYEGEKEGRPSKIIRLNGEGPKVIER